MEDFNIGLQETDHPFFSSFIFLDLLTFLINDKSFFQFSIEKQYLTKYYVQPKIITLSHTLSFHHHSEKSVIYLL